MYRSNVQLEKKYTYDFAPLEEALLHDDTPLAVQLLKQGVNANGTNYSTIGLAKSVDIVRLLISYGADIKRQQKVHDLVYWAARRNEDYDRFSFFFSYADLNEANQYGKGWFNHLVVAMHTACGRDVLIIAAKAILLLQYGCHYNASDRESLMRVLDIKVKWGPDKTKNKILAMRQQFKTLFVQHQERQTALVPITQSHNNICTMLQQRTRTGNQRTKS